MLPRVVRVCFTPNLARHVASAPVEVEAATLRRVLDAAFRARPGLRDYVLDDQGRLRRHMSVFVDGKQIADRGKLDDAVPDGAEVYVMQALSGG